MLILKKNISIDKNNRLTRKVIVIYSDVWII